MSGADRDGALALLSGVLDRKRSLAEQLSQANGPLAALAEADRARAQSLATGTLRHLGRIDAVLAKFLTRTPAAEAHHALRLATAEMLLDGVPAHAAVDSAVELTRRSPRSRHLTGLVNAVARKIADRGPALWETAREAPPPDWLAGPVRDTWGARALADIALAHKRQPPVDLTPKVPAEAALWAGRLGAEVLPTGSLRLAGRARISTLPGFAEGEWWVQDAAAALPARMAGPFAGLSVLDLCAAPGGKTMQLAASGARVTAVDASAGRVGRLRENLARVGLPAEVIVADALDWQPGDLFDRVVVDAPCSATGTIRRHPDLPYLRVAEDLPALRILQEMLLARAWGWTKPGGRVIYCTCSLLPVEGEERLAAFLGQVPEARVVPPDPGLGIEPAWIDARGGLRLRPDYWPERGGMDGFYAVVLEKPHDAPDLT